MKKMNSKTLLLDGDIIAYQCAAGAERPIKWGDDLWTLHCYESEVELAIDEFVRKLKEQANVDNVETAISHAKNFRKEVASYYKENRKDIRKPMLLSYAKDYLYETYAGVILDNLEADDTLGILSTQHPEKYIIWSLDKDLMTIPGLHLIDGEVVTISEEEADYGFYKQVLTGDMVDNYPGCPKIGPKTADKVLAQDSSDLSLWDKVVMAFMKAGLNEATAIEQARLARILRHGEYNFETGEVNLWMT
jgi:DNA polymerase-1